MFSKIKESLKGINYKLLLALIIMGLVPALYTTVRTFYLGGMPDSWAFSIAGQLGWVNLFYEVLNEAIILPLFYFLGKELEDKKGFTNKIKTGLIISGLVYLLLSIMIMSAAEPLLKLMAVNTDIIAESATYIRLESIANIVGILAQFTLVALVTLGRDKSVYLLTGIKLVLCLIFDTFLISTLSCSANMGVNGIAVSNIIVNAILFITTLVILGKLGHNIFNSDKLDFTWCKDFFKIGGISGLESLVRNLFYMLMICRMVNVVNEQGTYWVANNFIWGWMLLPILQLAELIKQEVATDKNHIKNNLMGYLLLTFGFILLWIILIPAYKPFMQYVLNFNEVDKLFNLVMILFGFYVLFAIQNIFDSIFYGLGKTNYMLAESILTNTIYYGIAFILYLNGIFIPTLTGIALMFGIGIAFDSIVSFIAFLVLVKREKISLK